MRACIAIIDATRARICEYDDRNAPGQELHEIDDRVNPGRRHIGGVFTDTKGGERATDRGGTMHQQATDDHRTQAAENRDEKFARDLTTEIARIVRDGSFKHLVVVAAPHMLGEIRKHADALERDQELKLDEVERDLGGLSDAEVHDHLAHAGILPPRKRLAAAR